MNQDEYMTIHEAHMTTYRQLLEKYPKDPSIAKRYLEMISKEDYFSKSAKQGKGAKPSRKT